MRRPAARPTREELEAARGKTLPDVMAPGLDVVFCGINPGLTSAALGYNFATPGNRFWPTLHRSGFTPRRLLPEEQGRLLSYGLGITNMAARPTARAAELTPAELRAGLLRLTATTERYRPRWLAILGVTAYRTAFARPGAGFGRQDERVAGAGVWVLPNPSGLNAGWSPDALATAYASLRAVARGEDSPPG
ncbi:G/U mismatch-specific DNA glycosylase [Streptomyces sp. NPDC049879]|uniref:G/U mismatch-specific DNA glycosylase n=1 Tax=Streptomyces sp. NPDC049879 TaxID=3365598 RepID=UPI00378E1A1B